MKKLLSTVCLVTFVASTAAVHAQQTREQAVSAMRKVDAKEMDRHVYNASPVCAEVGG